ncbi:MAG TPA: alanyl-tRNA editing protein [Candidatus Thermoplasmatota archaeon]|nr:alanyl-tRNA editing protein [Candidatus Thermoplasmatota archaeon]
MTKRLYLDDAYLRECEARVVSVDAQRVVLDRTILYAESGGQAPDHGSLHWDGQEAKVVDSQVVGGGHVGDVAHAIEGVPPHVGARVTVRLDWERRYGLMRHHTAAHVFAAVMKPLGAKFTGGQLYPDRGRFDAHFETWDPEIPKRLEAAVNAELAKGYEIRNYPVTREEFEKGDLLRTAENLLDPAITEIRVTDIVGLDAQADGGTHVKHTREVGRVVVGKADNKGKGHRRISFQCEG